MLILREEAEQDIASAYQWYEEQRPDLGKALVAELETRLHKLEKKPELYLLVTAKVRRALCKKFPYSIYFIHADTNIVVIGVLHQRRNPAVWQMRQ
jgi:plasmid stabilization system protein ParE